MFQAPSNAFLLRFELCGAAPSHPEAPGSLLRPHWPACGGAEPCPCVPRPDPGRSRAVPSRPGRALPAGPRGRASGVCLCCSRVRGDVGRLRRGPQCRLRRRAARTLLPLPEGRCELVGPPVSHRWFGDTGAFSTHEGSRRRAVRSSRARGGRAAESGTLSDATWPWSMSSPGLNPLQACLWHSHVLTWAGPLLSAVKGTLV